MSSIVHSIITKGDKISQNCLLASHSALSNSVYIFFLFKQKNWYWVSQKCSVRTFFYLGHPQQKLIKVRYGLSEDFFSKGQKPQRGGGVRTLYSPLVSNIKGLLGAKKLNKTKALKRNKIFYGLGLKNLPLSKTTLY